MITTKIYKREEGRRIRISDDGNRDQKESFDDATLLALKTEEGAICQEMQATLEAEKDTEIFSLELAEGTPASTFILFYFILFIYFFHLFLLVGG